MWKARFRTVRTLVVLPVFNEVEHVDEILDSVANYSLDILVVDDGSTDGTSERLARRDGISTIRHVCNVGYGQSLLDGFSFGEKNDFDWMITMDCDYQHEPCCLVRFMKEIAKDDADIISGSRYIGGAVEGVPAERAAINRSITSILNEHLSLCLSDAFCGFKAYRTEGVCGLSLSEKGYGLPLELWVRAARAGLRVREIPVPLIYYDCRRGFGGVLADARYRFAYYIGIIEKELGYGIGERIKSPFDS